MGLTIVKAKVFKTLESKTTLEANLLVDSGATYSLLPLSICKKLKLKEMRKMEFVLADGTIITRSLSECCFEIEGIKATSPIIIGQKGDVGLLGAVTLENLGLMLDPFKRKLSPMKLMLA